MDASHDPAIRSIGLGSVGEAAEHVRIQAPCPLGNLNSFPDSVLGDSDTGLSGELTASPVADMEQDVATGLERFKVLKREDLEHLSAAIGEVLADNTKKSYFGQWRRFCDWALKKSVTALPASSEQVAAYLSERFEQHGHKPATLYTAAAAIAFIHRALGLENPCDSPKVKFALKSVTRVAGSFQKQAEALTAESLAQIRAEACKPRRRRGGRTESAMAAKVRSMTDIAMISLMRDAMLRVSEAAAVKWGDIKFQIDGTGRLLIRRSKTDSTGEGAIAFLSSQTVEDLKAIRAGANDSDYVVGLSPNQISRRIKQAAQAVGLGENFSGHSPRVGMTCDLARAGVELPSLMTAGRWSSPRMPALYTRNESAGKGAVAQFYNWGSTGTTREV